MKVLMLFCCCRLMRRLMTDTTLDERFPQLVARFHAPAFFGDKQSLSIRSHRLFSRRGLIPHPFIASASLLLEGMRLGVVGWGLVDYTRPAVRVSECYSGMRPDPDLRSGLSSESIRW